MEIPVIVFDQVGEVVFWSKLAGWLSSTWHLAWLKQPILQKVTELEHLSSVTQILPAHLVAFLPLSALLYLPAFLLLLLFSLAWTRVDNYPLLPIFPLEKTKQKTNPHESSYPLCIETGQTTAQSQNEHKKRRQQSKAMARKGQGTLVKGMSEGLEGHCKHTACQVCWAPPLKNHPPCAWWGKELWLCADERIHTLA